MDPGPLPSIAMPEISPRQNIDPATMEGAWILMQLSVAEPGWAQNSAAEEGDLPQPPPNSRVPSEETMSSGDTTQDEQEVPQQEEVQPVADMGPGASVEEDEPEIPKQEESKPQADAEPGASVKECAGGSSPPGLTNDSGKKKEENRPYVCKVCVEGKVCGETYKRRDHLVRHQKQAHQGEQFQCPVCNRDFSRKDNLNQHKKKIHKLEDPDPEPPMVTSGPRPAAPPPVLAAKRPAAVKTLSDQLRPTGEGARGSQGAGTSPKRPRDQEDEGRRDAPDPSTPQSKKARAPLPALRPKPMADRPQAIGSPTSPSLSQGKRLLAKPRTPLQSRRPIKKIRVSQAGTKYAPSRPGQAQGSQAPAAASNSASTIADPPSSDSATSSSHVPARHLASLAMAALSRPAPVASSQGHTQAGEAPGTTGNPRASSSAPSSERVGGGPFKPINKR